MRLDGINHIRGRFCHIADQVNQNSSRTNQEAVPASKKDHRRSAGSDQMRGNADP